MRILACVFGVQPTDAGVKLLVQLSRFGEYSAELGRRFNVKHMDDRDIKPQNAKLDTTLQ